MSQLEGARPSPERLRDAIQDLRAADFKDIQRAGYHFQPNNFYSPLNDCAFLQANRDLWADAFEPAEIRWDFEHQMQVAREVAGYVDELRDIPADSGKETVYCWNNPFWNNADAMVQYGLVRSRRPRKVIEVGCGWSSLLLARALHFNESQGGHRAEVVQIEPYPRETIMKSLPAHWRQHRSILQRAPLNLFEDLGENDILFYDGSHCAKVASDVNWFFFRILPRVRSGVLIHLHDFFYPKDYPETWIVDRGHSWNEQYLLQAFLMHNDRYRIEICNSYLAFKRADELAALYKGIQPHWGASVWLKKV